MLLLYYQVMLLTYEHNYCARISIIATRQTPRATSAGSHAVVVGRPHWYTSIPDMYEIGISCEQSNVILNIWANARKRYTA